MAWKKAKYASDWYKFAFWNGQHKTFFFSSFGWFWAKFSVFARWTTHSVTGIPRLRKLISREENDLGSTFTPLCIISSMLSLALCVAALWNDKDNFYRKCLLLLFPSNWRGEAYARSLTPVECSFDCTFQFYFLHSRLKLREREMHIKK